MTEQHELVRVPGEGFLEGLAQKLGITANAATIYGQPIQHGGMTVVPVAKAKYGLGGGIGKKQFEAGSGGGGGVIVSPIGFIEIKDGAARFRPIREFRTTAVLITAGGILTLLTLQTVSKMLRH